MKKDVRLIYENYARSLNVAVADSSAGLPIGKKPLLISDEDDETLPTKSKKLVKKVQNFSQLVQAVQENIKDVLYSRVEDAIARAQGEEYYDPDLDDPEGYLYAQTSVVDNIFKGAEPEPPPPKGTPEYKEWKEQEDYISGVSRNVGIKNPRTREKLRRSQDIEHQKQPLLEISDAFIQDFSRKLAKAIVRVSARDQIKSYYHQKKVSEDRGWPAPDPTGRLFIPGNDPWVMANSDPNYPDQIYFNPTYGAKKVETGHGQSPSRDSDWNSRNALEGMVNFTLLNELGEGNTLPHIMDIITSGFQPIAEIMKKLMANPNLAKIKDYVSMYNKWFAEKKKEYFKKSRIEGEDYNTIKQYNNGFRWLQLLTKRACETEGGAMNHCASQKDPSSLRSLMFSLVDKDGAPHVTVSLDAAARKNASTNEIKGNSNMKPKKEYQPYIADFLKKEDFTNYAPIWLKDIPFYLEGDKENVDMEFMMSKEERALDDKLIDVMMRNDEQEGL